MHLFKASHIAAASILITLSTSPVAFGQTISCYPLPPGADPSTIILPPGIVLCPTTTPTTTTVAPAPTPAPTSDTTATPQTSISVIDGNVDEAHVGRGKRNGMDNGKKNGLYKEDHNQNDPLIMAGTISGNTLTVTAITKGRLVIGTILSGNGIPQPVKIIAFGTGTGGTGTYTIAPQ